MSIKLEVWGEYALFTRPEMKVERVSYDVMTPSAARGLIEAIYWHPGMRWCIDRIHVCAPIRFTNLRRNEVKSTIPARTVHAVIAQGKGELYLSTSKDIQQRAALLLRDVHYVIEAHFEMTEKSASGDNPGKFQDIMRRRLQKGTVLPPALLRLPGVSRPVPPVRRNPSLSGGAEGHPGPWLDALRHGLYRFRKHHAPLFPRHSPKWGDGSTAPGQ